MSGYRCMAEGRDGDWFAICVDLDIAVQGRAFPEVHDSLEQAIEPYLERVGELPENEQREFLARRAPWSIRMKFRVYSLLSRISRRDSDTHRQFTLGGSAQAHT